MKNEYAIREDYVEMFINSKGKQYICKIDFDTYEKIKHIRFNLNNGYVFNNKKSYLHSLILESDELQVDHINHDKLDNRKENLRLVTRSQNLQNRSLTTSPCTSRFKGVSWNKNSNKWLVHIKFEGNVLHLGLFDDELLAAKTYNEKAKELYQEFAFLNNV
jgi:hypothetical protein